MTPEQFCYWLQGYAELTGAEEVTPEVWASVKDHLKLVFEKKTPELNARRGDLTIPRAPRPSDYPGLAERVTC